MYGHGAKYERPLQARRRPVTPLDYVPLVLASIGFLLGFLHGDLGAGVLGSLFAFFSGKVLQSIVWSVTGPPTAT
jgi:hypothetical protein